MPIPDTLARKIMADFRAEKSMGPKKTLWRSDLAYIAITGVSHPSS